LEFWEEVADGCISVHGPKSYNESDRKRGRQVHDAKMEYKADIVLNISHQNAGGIRHNNPIAGFWIKVTEILVTRKAEFEYNQF
jgi:hypothetical protein